jgi:ABC-type nickel/cobalt efflux system permease component RcnA
VVLAIVTGAVFGMLSLLAPSTFLMIVGVRVVQLNEGAQLFAAYTGARELAIAVTLLVMLLTRASRGLAAVMLLTALANVFDVGHAILAQRWVQVPGALVFAIIFLAAALWLFNRPASHAIG